MNNYLFTEEQLKNAMFQATDFGNIPFSIQKFEIIKYIDRIKQIPIPAEKTYSELDMIFCFNAGLDRAIYLITKEDKEAVTFAQFLEILNNRKK